MAKLTVTAALAVVFLFLAVSPAHLQDIDHLPDLEKQVILLPGENVESKSAISEIPAEKQENTVTESAISAEEKQDNTVTESAESDPEGHTVRLTMISFRPINRGFPKRPFLSFRHGHRFNCHHRRQFKPWDPRFQKKENSYGNDMLMADDKHNFDPEMRPHHHHHDGPRFFFGPHHHQGDEEEHEHGPHHHHHGDEEEHEHGPHHHHHGDEEEHEHFPHHYHHGEEEEHEHGPHHHEHKGGFMKVFRKFLNQF